MISAIETRPLPTADTAMPATPELSKETQIFCRSINATSTVLYQMMCDSRNHQHKNFMFFVPNLFASLSMIYAGAPESLKDAMERAFHMGELKDEKWHAHFNAWSQKIQNNCGTFTESVSAMLKTDQQRVKFLQGQLVVSKLPLAQQFSQNLAYYRPECTTFQNPEDAKAITNAWVEKKTEGKIKNLVEDVSSELVLIMASAALFQGNWQYPFKKENNSQEVFYNSDGTKVKVPMMNKGIDTLKMAHDHGKDYSIEILELPFHGNISLLIINPEFSRWEKDAYKKCAPQLQNYMTADNLQKLLDNYEKRFSKARGLSIGIPKVTLEDKTDLMQELKQSELVKKILDADFNCMFNTDSKQVMKTPQLVSEVKFVMNEEGAEIAAASYSPTNAESCDPYFKVCGPFGIAVVDRQSKTIMGMGQVLKMVGEPVTKEW